MEILKKTRIIALTALIIFLWLFIIIVFFDNKTDVQEQQTTTSISAEELPAIPQKGATDEEWEEYRYTVSELYEQCTEEQVSENETKPTNKEMPVIYRMIYGIELISIAAIGTIALMFITDLNKV